MEEEEGPTETNFLMERNKTSEGTEEINNPTIGRRLRIDNNDGEHSLNMILVVEDFRLAFYLGFIILTVVGVILTKAFTDEDHTRILMDVYGISNTCAYFDFAPSTYVLPVLWSLVLIVGVVYVVLGIFRVRVACLEKKLRKCEELLLIIAYVYVGLSFVYFSVPFAVQPDRAAPITMVMHTIPYINFKVCQCVLQMIVVYFGVKVAWVGLKFPRWFHVGGIVHIILLVVSTVGAVGWALNALLDMGEKNLVGKGLWWSVRNETSKIIGDIIVNWCGVGLGSVLPLLQAIYICRHGTNTHAVVFAVSDNRVSAYEA